VFAALQQPEGGQAAALALVTLYGAPQSVAPGKSVTTSVDLPAPDYEAAVGRSIKGMKIGIPKEYRVKGMADEIEAAFP